MLKKPRIGNLYGLVSNIQKYTIHDGPGIRTEIFFTGCTLRCLWCSNPETISPRPRLGVYPDKCLTRDICGWCVKACPLDGAPLKFDGDGRLAAWHENERCNSEQCEMVKECENACPSRALRIWGERYTVPRLMKIIEEDRSFYDRTGGGVTLSGGDPLVQAEFAELLLTACKKAGIHTCVETALHVPWERAEPVLRLADLIITDVKHMNSARHREITGAGNELILANIRKLAELNKPVVARTPVVHGYNADEENLRATAEFLRDALGERLVQYQLLPYRKMGTEKYASLGEEYPMGDYVAPERDKWEPELLRLADVLTSECGVPAVAGSGKRLEL
ncbi:MAG: glycyl-radical enzyme activating protein [Oscillospiraceae bacterium]|nr:glycyl-radical enzyme activating protein [Oscillospiraceae bacterium]